MHQNTNTNNSSADEQSQEPLFYDITDMSGYDRNLRNARIWLYVLAALQALFGIYEYTTIATQEIAIVGLVSDVFIGLVFLALAIWSRKKPVAAFLTALIFYILVQLIMIISDPNSIVSGLLIKILFIIALVKAYRDARENEIIKKSLS